MLKPLAVWCWLLAALGFVAVAGSFFFTALSQPSRKVLILATPQSSAPGAGSAPVGLAERLKLPVVPSALNLPNLVASSSTSAAPPKRIRALLYVGADSRSEVLVNGNAVGNTPYVGNILCRPEAELRIDIIPPEGFPKTLRRLCMKEIRIEL